MNVYDMTVQYLEERPLILAQRKAELQQREQDRIRRETERITAQIELTKYTNRSSFNALVKFYSIKEWGWRNNDAQVQREVSLHPDYYLTQEEDIIDDYKDFMCTYGGFRDENPEIWERFEIVYRYRALALAKNMPLISEHGKVHLDEQDKAQERARVSTQSDNVRFGTKETPDETRARRVRHINTVAQDYIAFEQRKKEWLDAYQQQLDADETLTGSQRIRKINDLREKLDQAFTQNQKFDEFS